MSIKTIEQILLEKRHEPELIAYRIERVNKNGTIRDISFYLNGEKLGQNGTINISNFVASVTEDKVSKSNGGVTVHGCGMNMVFATLECLYSKLLDKNGITNEKAYTLPAATRSLDMEYLSPDLDSIHDYGM